MPGAALDTRDESGLTSVRLSGDWTLATLPQPLAALDKRLHQLAGQQARWELEDIRRLDSVGAVLLWRSWGRAWPAQLSIQPGHRHLIERAASIDLDDPTRGGRQPFSAQIGRAHV